MSRDNGDAMIRCRYLVTLHWRGDSRHWLTVTTTTLSTRMTQHLREQSLVLRLFVWWRLVEQ